MISKMIKKKLIFVLSILFVVILLSRCSPTLEKEQQVFNNICTCDSLSFFDYTSIYMDDDSNIISIPRKEPFTYYFMIDSSYLFIDGNKYHKFIVGRKETDIIGYINILDRKYVYRKNPDMEDILLFDFNVIMFDKWSNNVRGPFNHYSIWLQNKYYDVDIADTIFVFEFNYTDAKTSSGLYYKYMFVSEIYGMLKLSFSNGIECITKMGSKLESN